MIRRSRTLLLGVAQLFAAACGSEPLDAESGNLSGAGGNPAGKPGGTAGAPSAPLEVPDYSTSPCGRVETTERYDGQTHMPTRVEATCRAEGERTLLFVEDAAFGTRITQEGVNKFLYRFELVGDPRSFRPDLGILPTDEVVFGELPAAQVPEGKLPVFVIDSNGGGDGYLCGWCTRPELHLDAVELTPLDGDKALAIAAHEASHAIHRGYDAQETVWVDETLAEAAMVANGFSDEAPLKAFLARPNTNWGPAIQDFRDFHYGGGLVFGAYLWEYGGPELMRAITQDRKRSWAGIDSALAATGSDKDGHALFFDMAVALYFNDADRGFGFRSLALPSKVAEAALSTDRAATGTVQPYGLVYRSVPSGVGSLRVTGGAALRALLVVDRDPLEVQELELGTDVTLDDAPALLILTAVNTSEPVSYSVTPG